MDNEKETVIESPEDKDRMYVHGFTGDIYSMAGVDDEVVGAMRTQFGIILTKPVQAGNHMTWDRRNGKQVRVVTQPTLMEFEGDEQRYFHHQCVMAVDSDDAFLEVKYLSKDVEWFDLGVVPIGEWSV